MRNFKKGFTLIELLVVISIIGVLTALLLSNFVEIRARAKDAKLKAGLKEMKTAMGLYFNDNQVYPLVDVVGGVGFIGCGAAGTTMCAETDTFNSGDGTIYMKDLPEFTTFSNPGATTDNFLIEVTLNNASDPDLAKSATRCGQTIGSSYFVCSDY